MSDKVIVGIKDSDQAKVLFCLELADESGSDRHYFMGTGTQYDFEKKCDSLMPEAAKRALEADEKAEYHYVAWENIIEILAGMLSSNGYTLVFPKIASYRRGALNPIRKDVDFTPMVKNGWAGSYELLGEYGPKITEHNLKYNEE